MTPTERLQTLQQNIRSVIRLRGAKADSRFFEILKVLSENKVELIVVGIEDQSV